MENFFFILRAHNSEMRSLIWLKFSLIRDPMPDLVIYKFEKDQLKWPRKVGDTVFPIISY